MTTSQHVPDGAASYRLEPAPAFDLAALFRALWAGKWVVLLTTALMIFIAGYYAFQMAGPRYTATTTLKVDRPPITLRDVTEAWAEPGTDLASLNTEVTILTSADILGQVVARLDLLNDPEFNRYLAPVSPYTLRSLRTKARHFLAGTAEVPPDDLAVFNKTIENLRSAVSAMRPRDTYIFQISARSRDADKAALIANTAAEIYIANQVAAKDDAARIAIGWLTSRVTELQTALHAQETAVTNLIANAQLQEDGKLDALSNAVLTLDQDIAGARATLALMRAEDQGTARQAGAIAQEEDRIRALIAQRNRMQAQLSAQSAGLVTLNQVQREADATREVYETYLARLQETRIQRGLAQPDSQIIASASTGRYAGPRKVMILWLGALVGATAGIALLILQHSLRQGVPDAATLRQITGLPVIAQAVAGAYPAPRRFIGALARRKTMPLLDAAQSIRAGPSDRPQKVIMFTATTAGERKTHHALAMAYVVGRAHQNVLFLSADRQSVKRFHGLPDTTEDPISVPELRADVMTVAGVDALLGPAFGDQMKALWQRYDAIIIDAPPLLTSLEARALAQYADQTFLVVRWAKTPVALVKAAMAYCRDHDIRISGTILSHVSRRQQMHPAARNWRQSQQSAVPI